MILFIAEGKKPDMRLIKAMMQVFPEISNPQQCYITTYGTDIYKLYKDIKGLSEDGGDADVVALLKERKKHQPQDDIHKIRHSAEVGQIFLIFDYDFQKAVNDEPIPLDTLNHQVEEMLRYFDDETDEGRGKLYISYPMMEAILDTRIVSEDTQIETEFLCRTVEREQCSCYKSKVNPAILQQLSPPSQHNHQPDTYLWRRVIEQNLIKANLLCQGEELFPQSREKVSQQRIFQAQVQKFVLPESCVAVLSAIPLFLFEYFPMEVFLDKCIARTNHTTCRSHQ